MTWSAAQYVKFEEERTRPGWDRSRVPNAEPRRAADLGCGPGNSTEALRARYPDAEIVGVDSSADMIAAARKRLPDIAFELADIEGWPGAGFDVILANAVIHWIPDHEALLPALIGKLSPGGSLAVQIPDNLDEPSQRLMLEVTADGPWVGKLADAAKARAAIRGTDWYFRLLKRHAPRVDIWRTTYFHPLAGARAIVEWFGARASGPSSTRSTPASARPISRAMKPRSRRPIRRRPTAWSCCRLDCSSSRCGERQPAGADRAGVAPP